jgi:hypothetical protein
MEHGDLSLKDGKVKIEERLREPDPGTPEGS